MFARAGRAILLKTGRFIDVEFLSQRERGVCFPALLTPQ
jgi:hypothetical protein